MNNDNVCFCFFILDPINSLPTVLARYLPGEDERMPDPDAKDSSDEEA